MHICPSTIKNNGMVIFACRDVSCCTSSILSVSMPGLCASPCAPQAGCLGGESSTAEGGGCGCLWLHLSPSSDGVFCTFLSNFGAQLLRHYVCCTASVRILFLVRRLLDWSSGVSYWRRWGMSTLGSLVVAEAVTTAPCELILIRSHLITP